MCKREADQGDAIDGTRGDVASDVLTLASEERCFLRTFSSYHELTTLLAFSQKQ